MRDKLINIGVYIVKNVFPSIYVKIWNDAVSKVYDDLHYDCTEQDYEDQMPDELLEESYKVDLMKEWHDNMDDMPDYEYDEHGNMIRR